MDERFTRYLTNNESGFAFYSGMDKHTTYAFDREGWRFTASDPSDACLAAPRRGVVTTPDPIPGLDDNDEMVFMYSDTGPKPAPANADLPKGILGLQEVQVTDPFSGKTRFGYVALAGDRGPEPEFSHDNGYVRYERDPDADVFLASQSSFSNYGVAPAGPHWDPASQTCVDAPRQRRPRDTAWITTPTYKFRYEGRWLMTEIRISPDGGINYGPDLIDQWKARAFQQRPGGVTPCCGFEEEVNNWGGSSILMGERWGPVRAIRETWGADSATNNIRREVFYRDEVRQQNSLRVHPIPPLDGIYVQWDYNAGKMTTYRNPYRPEGVPIDGQNDEVFGNFYVAATASGGRIKSDDEMPLIGPQDHQVGTVDPNCRVFGQRSMCNDIDLHDLTFSGPHGALSWEQISGPFGTLVTRWTLKDHTAGDGYTLFTYPYYRDDSCFDDGTGGDPGPHLRSRNVDSGEFGTWTDPETGEVHERRCWQPGEEITGDPEVDRKYWQGSIGTHGLHLHLIADSDNAMLTEPVTEANSEYRMVMLPGDPGNVGEQFGRSDQKPLVVTIGRLTALLPWTSDCDGGKKHCD